MLGILTDTMHVHIPFPAHKQFDATLKALRSYVSGNHECEVLGRGPEATESAYAWKNCTKNPGHSQFIPAPEFCLDHLPKWCADPTVVECVRAISALTVRLRVNYTSWGRPDGYSFANHRGSNILHTGSGWVRDIKVGSGPCRCPECQQSSFPKQVWYEVHLETACHVCCLQHRGGSGNQG